MKKYRTLIIAAAAIILLGAVYLLVSRDPVEAEPQTADMDTENVPLLSAGNEESETPESLITIDSEYLESIAVERDDFVFTLLVGEEVPLTVKEYPDIPINEMGARSIVFALVMAGTGDKITDAGNLDDYGLLNPAAVTTLSDGETSQKLFLGSKNPDGTMHYVMRENDDAVYLIQAYFAESLFPDLYTIREKVLRSVNLQEVTYIAVRQDEEAVYTIGRYQSSDPFDPGLFPFYFVQPFDPPKGVNDSTYFELLAPLQEGLMVYEFIDDPDPLETYGLDDTQAVEFIVVSADESGLSLKLGNQVDDSTSPAGIPLRYALAPGTEAPVLAISEAAIAFTEIEPIDYVESFAALIGIDQVSGYTLTIGDTALEGTIERSGDSEDITETFFIDGNEVDEDSFKDLYQVLIGRQIEGAADAALVEATETAARGDEPLLKLVYHHIQPENGDKVIELLPYDDEFSVLRVDGGNKRFLIGMYQIDYILDNIRELGF